MLQEVTDVWLRVWPVLGFLVLIKVASDLLDAMGVFDVGTRAVAVLGRGRTWQLFGLFVALCVLSTTVLSLDATAVLLTPVAITVARELDVDAAPFVVASLWLANTASLLLPVSNLTNLLAQEHNGWSATTFVSQTLGPQVALLVVTVAVLALVHRRSLGSSYVVPDRLDIPDRPSLWVGVAAVGVFAVVVVAGVAPWLAAIGLVAVLAVTLRVRRPGRFSGRRLVTSAPWPTAGFALALFLAMDGLSLLWGDHVARLVGAGDGFGALLRLAGVGALAANLANNLPAYLLVEPTAASPARSIALLIGVNAGALLTPWGALATLLWLSVCRQRGVRLPWTKVALQGLVLVPLAILAAVGVLSWMS